MTEVLRVGNCSGFYGDRLSAMRELLEGGDVDVVTGDYLAELTMLILGKDQLKDASLGYARTFVTQVADCLGLALEKGVRIVANAGGLNPAGLVEKLREVAAEQGLAPQIAWVDGDNLAPRAAELGLAGALTANAYLGAFGIARALEAGADIVVTGRVTDASVVVGPAIWRHGWTPEQYDELAGAVVAGHVIECGTQATGGNFSGFLDLPRDAEPLGFPIAEIAADGSSVITKHAGTGGLVSVDTVTAQLMYEVQSTHYLGPDVTVDLSTIELAADGDDRVRVSGDPRAGPAAAAQGLRQRARWLPQPDGVRAHRARPRGEGRVAARPARRSPEGRVGDLVDGPPPAAGLRDRGRRVGAAALRGEGRGRQGRRQAVHGGGGRARPGVVPRLHADRPAGRTVAVRHLPAGVRRPRHRRAHRAPARRQHRGRRRPAGGRTGRAGDQARTGDHRLDPRGGRQRHHAADRPGHVRAREVRRQGRRRQRGAVGARRRDGATNARSGCGSSPPSTRSGASSRRRRTSRSRSSSCPTCTASTC